MMAATTEPAERPVSLLDWLARPVRRLAAPSGLRCHLAAMVLLGLLPPVAALCFGGLAVLQEAHKRTMEGAAQAGAAAIDRELASWQAVGSVLSQPELLRGLADPQAVQKVADAFGTSLHANLIVWRGNTTRMGAWLTAGSRDPEAPDDAKVAQRSLATSAAVMVEHADRPDVSVFIPVDASSDTVVEASLSREHLAHVLSVSPDLVGARALLATTPDQADGHPASTIGGGTYILPGWLRHDMAAVASGAAVGGEGGNSTMAAFAAPSRAPGWRVLIVQPMSSVQKNLRGPLALVGILTVVSIVMAGASALLIGSWLARPLRRLSAAARAVAAGVEVRSETARSTVAEIEELRLSVARAYEMSRRRAAAERLALEEARTGQELLASVINGTADLIDVKDLDLALVLLNRAALLHGNSGRGEWQFLGRREGEFLPPDEARQSEQADREVIETGEMRSTRAQRIRPDGKMATFAVTKTPWRDVAGRIAGVVTVMHDVSDHRAAEERLASVQAELMRATRLSTMGAMASGLAHELNQPLAAATNFLNAAARLLVRDPPDPFLLSQARIAVTDAREQTLRAGGIVRRLRDFVGRGESELKVEKVDELVHEIRRVACAGGALDPRHIVIKEGAIDVVALVDGTQIQQVLLNLIRNASEAIGDAIHPVIELAWRRIDCGIEITVADNGPGLAPEIRDRLFEPFTSTKALGMGIGLAICRTIVEGHGGTLVAEDHPTGGALFRITLPPVHLHPDTETETQACILALNQSPR